MAAFDHRNVGVPWLSTNGLNVKSRTSRSLLLSWKDDDFGTSATAPTEQVPSPRIAPNPKSARVAPGGRRVMISDNLPTLKPKPKTLKATKEEEHLPALKSKPMHKFGRDEEWYEVQIKRGQERAWKTIYKGFANRFEVKDLAPDHNVSFRMKRNGDSAWGSPIVAATDTAPPSAEDLQRAVQCNCEEMVLRILGGSKSTHLKKMLHVHDKAGYTPLMIACVNGNYDMINTLLAAGSEINAVSMNTEKTALMLAVFQGCYKCVQLLDRNGADWTLKDRSGCGCLHHAVNGGHVKVFQYTLEKVGYDKVDELDNLGWTPLMRAAVLGVPMEIFKILMLKGANPNAVDKGKSKSILIAAAMQGKKEMVEYLLENQANPNYQNVNGQTALSIAQSMKYKDVVALLVKKMGVPPQEVKKAHNPREFRDRIADDHPLAYLKHNYVPKFKDD